MKIAYLAGPYRDPRGTWYEHQNIERARAAAVELWRAGYAVICPHSNTAHFGGAVPTETILAGDLELLRRCDELFLLPGWELSEGALAEKRLAEELNMPIHYPPGGEG